MDRSRPRLRIELFWYLASTHEQRRPIPTCSPLLRLPNTNY